MSIAEISSGAYFFAMQLKRTGLPERLFSGLRIEIMSLAQPAPGVQSPARGSIFPAGQMFLFSWLLRCFFSGRFPTT